MQSSSSIHYLTSQVSNSMIFLENSKMLTHSSHPNCQGHTFPFTLHLDQHLRHGTSNDHPIGAVLSYVVSARRCSKSWDPAVVMMLSERLSKAQSIFCTLNKDSQRGAEWNGMMNDLWNVMRKKAKKIEV